MVEFYATFIIRINFIGLYGIMLLERVTMIRRKGYYILNIDDWIKICKFFSINPKTTCIEDFKQLTFIETQVFDIYTEKHLFSFYNHDGMIRIPKKNRDFYEIPIHNIIGKNPEPISQEIMSIFKKNVHGPIKSITNKISEKKNSSEK